MSKIYILKEDHNVMHLSSCENPKDADITDYVLMSDCVPVDIDELYDDYNEYLADWLNKDTTGKDTYQSFSEYLQERMK